MATRWGILSAGKICNDFTAALVTQDQEKHQAFAVAARSLDRAQTFAERFGIKNAYGSYQELVDNADVDIVYIGSATTQHYKHIKLCLEAGKHVLCEKPITISLAAAEEVYALAREKKLFLMEGYWTRFFPVYGQVRRELSSGTLGDVRMVTAKFFIKIPNGLSALLDIGCYTVMFADYVYGELPERVYVQAQLSEKGSDTTGAVILTYSDGRTASLTYSELENSIDNTATILGTKGYVHVGHQFHCPTEVNTPSGWSKFPHPVCTRPMMWGKQSIGFMYEQDAVRKCLLEGLIECPLMTSTASLNIMRTIDMLMKQMGATIDIKDAV